MEYGSDTQQYDTGATDGMHDPKVDTNAWVQSLQDYLDGKPSGYNKQQGIPPGYSIKNGKVVKDAMAQWNPWIDLAGGGAMFGLGALLGPTVGAAGAAGAGGSAAGSASAAPAASAGGSVTGSIPSAFGVNAVDTVASAAPAAGGLPSWLMPAIKAAVPIGMGLANRPDQPGANGLNGTGLPPELLAQLQQLIQLSLQRQQETAPVHQAAMALASKLATNQNNLPSMAGARADTQGPGPSPTMNPQVAAAMARLMGR